ncbi:unnamed protein product [Victoria cruziana]
MDAARGLRRVSSKWLVLCSVLGGGGAAAIASTDDPATTLKICTSVPLRLLRSAFTAFVIAFDYRYSLWGLPDGSKEKAEAKHEAHVRCAHRLRDLCFRNGGIYIKLGQHIGQLEYLVPEEYVQVMRASMLNRCPMSSYNQVCKVFLKELGRPPNEVQHTHLTDTAAIDTAMVDLIVNFLSRIFPAFDYSEKCLENFKKLSPHLANYIYAPKVYWNLSSSRLLTMEFMDAAEVTDVSEIRRLGIKPNDVAKLVSQVFAEMIFKHGFVHCDPHAANMMVRPSGRNFLGRRKPQLILLDHGLYKTLDFSTRTSYAALWKALIFADVNEIKENSVKLGAGEDLYTLFAGILTMRPWNRVIDPAVDHLFLRGNGRDRAELQDSSLDTFFIIGRVSSSAVIETRMLLNKSFFSRVGIILEGILLEVRLLALHIASWLLQLRKALSAN